MIFNSIRRFSLVKLQYPKTVRLPDGAEINKNSVAKFRNVEKSVFKTLHSPFIHRDHNRILDLFEDYSYIVRMPFIESIEIVDELGDIQRQMKNTIVPKILFHGEPGCGISTIIASLAEYLHQKNHILFCFPWIEGYLKRSPDYCLSNEFNFERNSHISGDIFDFPERSALWLKNFAKINEKILDQANPTIQNDVYWSAKENSPKGTSWLELINFCSSRIKYSTDCIGILLKEARNLSSQNENSPSFSILADGINALWCRGSTFKDTKGNKLGIDNLALFIHLKRALRGDWKKGFIIAAPNHRASWFTDREEYDPGYMLTRPGFEAMNPFIPIKVENMSTDEFNQMLSFYTENNWLARDISHTQKGRSELEAFSERNFKELFKIVSEY